MVLALSASPKHGCGQHGRMFSYEGGRLFIEQPAVFYVFKGVVLMEGDISGIKTEEVIEA